MFYFDDLVQEGVIGMIKGIEKYDVSRNTNFSTYAIIGLYSRWIGPSSIMVI